MKVKYTDEQIYFMEDFRQNILSFSDPGTGKTQSAIGGLLTAELFHGIPGENIYAMSFTNMATAELKIRHQDSCKKLGISQKVQFNTLHKICMSILHENYEKLGFFKFNSPSKGDWKSMTRFIQNKAITENYPVNNYNVGDVVRAVNSLNAALVFDRDHVESKYAFINNPLDFEQFSFIRKKLYELSKVKNSVQVDSILLYTLELLIKFPEVSKEFKSKCKILLVDEFQDMSLLQLRIISLLSDNVVAIGDIKQQIYAFNGACQEIVEQYKKYFPVHREANLTQSFRCGKNIAKYATTLILPNKVGGESYKGTDIEGVVNITNKYNLDVMCDNIADAYIKNKRLFPKTIMFLFRNNASVTPLAEALWQRQIPFRTSDNPSKAYKPAQTLPLIEQMCDIIEMVKNPTSPAYAMSLRWLFKEFSKYRNEGTMPFILAMRESGHDIFSVNYTFKDQEFAEEVFGVLLDLQEDIRENKKVIELFKRLLPIVEKGYIKRYRHLMDQAPDYYLRIVTPLIVNKTYSIFVKDELKKRDFIEECIKERRGLRAMTFHAAKGAEADIVNIIDAEEGIIPNISKLNKMLYKQCEIDASREIRNERSLVYVAATRAKEVLNIFYTNKLSSLLTGENEFKGLDVVYSQFTQQYLDVETFKDFTEDTI